jgi:hypothetical protein
MMFVGQVALASEIFGDMSGQMAYIFMTDDTRGNVPTMDPEGGENAVVVQPGVCEMSVNSASTGPTLEERSSHFLGLGTARRTVEYATKLRYEEDPDELSHDELVRLQFGERERYFAALAGSKIGGTPCWIQGSEYPHAGPWRLLLQIEAERPLQLSLGDGGAAYAFLDAHGLRGRLLWQSR